MESEELKRIAAVLATIHHGRCVGTSSIPLFGVSRSQASQTTTNAGMWQINARNTSFLSSVENYENHQRRVTSIRNVLFQRLWPQNNNNDNLSSDVYYATSQL